MFLAYLLFFFAFSLRFIFKIYVFTNINNIIDIVRRLVLKLNEFIKNPPNVGNIFPPNCYENCYITPVLSPILCF